MGVRNYPVLPLTSQELERIPRAEEQPEGFVRYVPIGTIFRCTRSPDTPDIVIGKVVNGIDADCAQFGARLDIPERFVNRYRAQIIS